MNYNEKKRYSYIRHMGHYNVYDPVGTKITSYHNEEDARKEVYRLNGWEYKPKYQKAI